MITYTWKHSGSRAILYRNTQPVGIVYPVRSQDTGAPTWLVWVLGYRGVAARRTTLTGAKRALYDFCRDA